MKIRALTYILLVGALFGSAGCSELAGSGELVSIPTVSFTCSAPNCTGPDANDEFRVIYSTFNCAGAGQTSFYAKRSSSSLSLNCSGASCSGTANDWVDENGVPTTLIPADNYTICVVVFRQGSIVGGATAQDAYAEEAVVVNSSSPPFNITSFSNGAP